MWPDAAVPQVPASGRCGRQGRCKRFRYAGALILPLTKLTHIQVVFPFRENGGDQLVEPAEIISFEMSQRMLHGISDRAERQTAPYFDATPDSADEALAAEVARHPVFRLVPEAAGDS